MLAEALAVPPARTHQHSGLRERDVGARLTGLTRSEAAAREPAAFAALATGGVDEKLPGGGESIVELQARISGALNQVAARHAGR